jgi:type II secretory pathway pseudopilin PulG
VKRINGLTLIETMVAIMLLSLMILGTISYFTQRAETMRAKQLGNDMALIMNAIDKKLQLDAYSDKSWKSSSWANTTEFMQKLIGEELRTSNSSCGKPNGWVSELAPDPLALVPCDRLSGDFLPSGVQVSANYATESAADGGRNISIFTIDYGFKDPASFKKNFGTLVKAQKALDKFESAKNLTVHSYNYFNATNKAPMTLDQCLASAQGCGLRTQIESFVGLSTDKVRIDGKNDLMGEIDFDNADTKCTQWDYVGGLWKSKEIKCTVQGGFDSKVGSVDAFINNTTIAERISLKDQCTLTTTETKPMDNGVKIINENWLSAADAKQLIVPCGFTKEGLTITSGFNKTNSKIVIAVNAITREAELKIPVIKYNANFYGGLQSKTMTVEKSLNADVIKLSNKFSSLMTDLISSSTTDINRINDIVNASKAITNAMTPTLGTFNNAYVNYMKTGNLTVGQTTVIDTRDPKYISSNGTNYQRSISEITGNLTAVKEPVKPPAVPNPDAVFYSGYSTSNASNTLADQSWNTLKINNITGSNTISILGSTKNDETIAKEMNVIKPPPFDMAIYRDGKTFYSDVGSDFFKAQKLFSEGILFTYSTPPTPITSTQATNNAYIDADSGFADEQTIIKGSMAVYSKADPTNPRVSISHSGVMTIRGKNLGGGNTTADFMLGWPATAEGSIWENGFRNKVFRSSLVTIVKGVTKIYGNVVQWKPLHMNNIYQAYDVCDRPGGTTTTCLTWGWNELNTMQAILQNVQAQYDKIQAKFPIKIGDKGDIGEQGFKGAKGQTGDNGPIGERGPRGPMEYLKVNI